LLLDGCSVGILTPRRGRLLLGGGSSLSDTVFTATVSGSVFTSVLIVTTRTTGVLMVCFTHAINGYVPEGGTGAVLSANTETL
jgi:hypothetical protein